MDSGDAIRWARVLDPLVSVDLRGPQNLGGEVALSRCLKLGPTGVWCLFQPNLQYGESYEQILFVGLKAAWKLHRSLFSFPRRSFPFGCTGKELVGFRPRNLFVKFRIMSVSFQN